MTIAFVNESRSKTLIARSRQVTLTNGSFTKKVSFCSSQMTNQVGSNILKIFSQKSFGFIETRFMEQKGVNWISYWIREAKRNALNDWDSMEEGILL